MASLNPDLIDDKGDGLDLDGPTERTDPEDIGPAEGTGCVGRDGQRVEYVGPGYSGVPVGTLKGLMSSCGISTHSTRSSLKSGNR